MNLRDELRVQYRENFGSESASFNFTASSKENWPQSLEILVWHPDPYSDLTTLATLGMSDIPMSNGERAELHWAWEGQLSQDQENQLVEFLANLALFPFAQQQHCHWWQVIGLDGSIPFFQNKTAVLLHPPFHEEGWAFAQTEQGDVRILNVVPIVQDEKLLIVEHGVSALDRLQVPV